MVGVHKYFSRLQLLEALYLIPKHGLQNMQEHATISLSIG